MQRVGKLQALYKKFKNDTTAIVYRIRELTQRPNPPKSIERVKNAMEDVAVGMNLFTTAVAIQKQQREEERRVAARQAAQKAARSALKAAQKARSESEKQFQLARDELVRVGLNPEIHGKDSVCYFCGLKGYRARYCPRRAGHSRYRRVKTIYGMRWVHTPPKRDE